jgi:hypothetical protein
VAGGDFMFKKILLGLVSTIIVIIMVIGLYNWRKTSIHEKEAQEFEENILDFTPEDVIAQYFEWLNNGNRTGRTLTLYRGCRRYACESGNAFRNLRNVELLYINEFTDEALRRYEHSGVPWLPEYKEFYDMKVFAVTFDLRRWEQIGINDGINEFLYVMVRESPEKPWLIYSSTKF